MKHFKWALIATAISLVTCIVLGIALVAWMHSSGGLSDQRAQVLGQGMGMLSIFVVAPFWIYGAAQFGKERRAAKSKPPTKNPEPRRTKAS